MKLATELQGYRCYRLTDEDLAAQAMADAKDDGHDPVRRTWTLSISFSLDGWKDSDHEDEDLETFDSAAEAWARLCEIPETIPVTAYYEEDKEA